MLAHLQKLRDEFEGKTVTPEIQGQKRHCERLKDAYTAEELELLMSDPQLLDLKRKTLDERQQAADDERRAQEQMAALDAHIMAPLDDMREHQSQWSRWKAEWSVYTDREDAQLYTEEVHEEQRLWVEDDELGIRQRVEEEEDATIQHIFVAAHAKQRYLVESCAWSSDWVAEWEGKWEKERDDAKKHVLQEMEHRDTAKKQREEEDHFLQTCKYKHLY